MAVVVIVIGAPVSLIFQLCIPERPQINPPKLKWYKWLTNPTFYMVTKQ